METLLTITRQEFILTLLITFLLGTAFGTLIVATLWLHQIQNLFKSRTPPASPSFRAYSLGGKNEATKGH